MADGNDGPKLGEGSLAAFVRQGLKELAQALPAFPDSIRPVEEPGMFGNPTPQIVTQEMGAGGYQAMLDDIIAQQPAAEPPGQGIER
jgi:hypothetical protein